MNVWRVVVLRPIVLLVWLNAGAATLLFGVALFWAQYDLINSIQWIVWVLPTAGFLSLVAFIGSWTLERPRGKAS